MDSKAIFWDTLQTDEPLNSSLNHNQLSVIPGYDFIPLFAIVFDPSPKGKKQTNNIN